MLRLLSIILGLCAWAAGVQGQPSGALQFNFTAEQLLVWDLSGDYSRTNGESAAQLTLAHEPSGKVTGTGGADFTSGNITVHARETSVGRVGGIAGKRVVLNSAGQGVFSGQMQSIPLSGTFRGKLALVLDATNRTVSGTQSATLCISGVPCRTISTNASFELPAGMDGTWSLALNVAPTNKSIRGTAVATLSNGRAVSLNVRGNYASRTGFSKLRLTGTRSGNFVLTVDSEGNLKAVGGRFFGQKLVWRAVE